jgi:probable LLM family oxidoreductase
MAKTLEFGLHTFGDVTERSDGGALPHAQVIRDVIEQGVLADQCGIDFFGVGEHHRADFAVSAPEIVLACIAGRTENIRVGSAVTVLSSDDPVRVLERFATLCAVANGRAEIILGRGSFTESFPLFGYELSDYDALFEEKLDLFAALTRQKSVTWQGKLRPPLTDQQVFPSMERATIRRWVAVGASPESVLRAARNDMALMIAVIGGEPQRFSPFVELYHKAFEKLGKPARAIGVHSSGYIAESDAQAREEFWPNYKRLRDQVGSERGWPPIGRAKFELEADRGSLYVGSPQTVAQRIVTTVKALGISRFDMKYSAGPMPHEKLLRSIELYGSKVIPLVRDLLN